MAEVKAAVERLEDQLANTWQGDSVVDSDDLRLVLASYKKVAEIVEVYFRTKVGKALR